MDHNHLTRSQQVDLRRLIEANQDVFALDPSELGTTNIVTHTIDTGNQPPIRQQPCRTPFALREQVTMMVQDMLNNHVIQHSNSPWVSPIILVKKKDGSFHFCIDYCRLNSVTKMDVFPLPQIDDTLDLLSQSTSLL